MKAIDIVIIPSQEIIDLSIEINKQLTNNENIELDKNDQIPHISLVMGGIDDANIDKVWNETEEIAQKYIGSPLIINEIRLSANYTGLHLKRTKHLWDLHLELVEKIMPQLNYNNDLSSVAQSAGAKPKTLQWLNGFPENSSKENFAPHITIGDDKLVDTSLVSLPIEFPLGEIALCHLGNYCTCHTILHTTAK